MKVQEKTAMGAIAAVTLTALLASDAFAKERIQLTLEVVDSGSGPILEIDRMNTNGPPCARANHPGCFEIRSGETAEFSVTLKHSDHECRFAEWRLLDVMLGGQGEPDSESGKPATWGNLSAEAVGDFGANGGSGIIERIVTRENRTLVFWDDNQFPMSIWYTVRAQNCEDETQIVTMDPRIDNKGTGHSN